jgi:hypothetical protein
MIVAPSFKKEGLRIMHMEVYRLTKTILLLTTLVFLISACFYIISDQSHRVGVGTKKNSHHDHHGMICLRAPNRFIQSH